MAVVDASYKSLWLNIITNGAAGDAQLWNNSQLKLSTGRRHLPQCEPFPGYTTEILLFLIGDDAFDLKRFLAKHYAHRNLTHEERISNRLSRERHIVENAFGIMSMCF